jgi:DNA-binding SARP family transcriptional activator
VRRPGRKSDASAAGLPAPLEVRLLGDLEILSGGQTVELTSERLRSLFAVLAMSVPAPVLPERLGRRIWGHSGPQNVRRSVQTLIARLRGALGQGSIHSSSVGYRLVVAPERVDAHLFDTLLEAAGRADDPDDERRLLDSALALWRGTPFEGIESNWLTQFHEPRLVERYLTALERTIDLDIKALRLDGLAAELRDLTGRYPRRQTLWVRLLDVLDLDGRPAEALAAYELVRRRLTDEVGVEPGPELRRVQDRLLAADAAVGLATSQQGRYGPTGRSSRLPPDMPGFAGRSTALASLDRLLPHAGLSSGAPIVIAVITGAGGVGKSALAVHWAHQVWDQFPDGQLYVDLLGHGGGDPMDPVVALDQMLRDLGHPSDEIPAGLEARSALFRSRLSGRRMLLLLDNARDEAQVRPLMPGTTSMVVITSRSQLRGLVAREHANRITLDADASEGRCVADQDSAPV